MRFCGALMLLIRFYLTQVSSPGDPIIEKRKTGNLSKYSVMSLHGHASLKARLHILIRLALCDMDFVERHVPDSGFIVDLGCGHGFFSNLLTLRGPDRDVLGIDLSASKIGHARASIGGRENIRFMHGDILDCDLPPCDAVTILDVMYLLPKAEQARIIRRCREILREGGILVWKAQENRPRWKYACTYAQEALGSILRITGVSGLAFHFLSREETLAMMKEAGFRARAIDMNGLPYPDVLYIGEAV